jgi:hypothetical protein
MTATFATAEPAGKFTLLVSPAPHSQLAADIHPDSTPPITRWSSARSPRRCAAEPASRRLIDNPLRTRHQRDSNHRKEVPSMNDATNALLRAKHLNLPDEVAAALLTSSSAAALAEIPRDSISMALRFSGKSAIACARSHPVRAAIIAARTDDVDVQRVLVELSAEERFRAVLRELAGSELVTDPTLVQTIHDQLYLNDRSPYGQGQVIDRVDLDHALTFFENHPSAYGRDLARLGTRIGVHVARDGDTAPAVRFLRVCAQNAEPDASYTQPSRELYNGVGALGTALVANGASAILAQIAAGADDEMLFYLSIIPWSNATVIDEHLAELALSQIDVEEFSKWQRREAEIRSEGSQRDVAQYPSQLKRPNLQCTDAAWRLIAAQWPGLLREPIRELVNDDPQRDLLVELAIASKRTDLATMLIDRKYHSEQKRSGPLLDADQFRIAAHTLRDRDRVPLGLMPPYGLGGAVTLASIPRGATVDDVLSVWSDYSIGDIVETLCDARQITWHEWHPTAAEFSQILDRCQPRMFAQAVSDGTHAYMVTEYRPCDDSSFAAARPYLDATVDRTPARNVLEHTGGPEYIAVRLTESFGTDTERWLSALHLVERSSLPLSSVIATAAKIG